MLTREEKELLRREVHYAIVMGAEVIAHKRRVPSVEELEEMAYEKIKKLGFSQIKRASPTKANCIVRIFRMENFCYKKIPWEKTAWDIYGFDCYTKRYDDWITECDEGVQPMNFEKNTEMIPIMPEEYFLCDCNFYDIYLKVSR